MMTSNPNTNLNLTIEAWTDILIERWLDKITKLNIYCSGNLLNGISSRIELHQKIPQSVHFEFPYYGRFVDMGVGRGAKLEDVKSGSFYLKAGLVGHARKPKQWYSKTFYGQFYKLTSILAEKYGMIAAVTIKESIEINITTSDNNQ